MTVTMMTLAPKEAIGGCTDYEGDRQTGGQEHIALGAGCPGACCFVICPPTCPPLIGNMTHCPFRSRLGIFELK